MKNKKYPYYSVPEPSDLKDLVNYCAEYYQEKKAFWYREKKEEITVSFHQMRDDINAFGTYLSSIGMQHKHIAVLGENSYAWIVSYFAIVNGGGVVVPIDHQNTVDDIKHLIKKAEVSLLIHSDNFSEEAEQCEVQTLCLNDLQTFISEGKQLLKNGERAFAEYKIDKEKLCAIVFTSGTTKAWITGRRPGSRWERTCGNTSANAGMAWDIPPCGRSMTISGRTFCATCPGIRNMKSGM